jgi:hypothetical protein
MAWAQAFSERHYKFAELELLDEVRRILGFLP